MKKKRSAYLSCLLCAALLLSALGVPTLAETPARQVGDKTAGFVVTQLSRLDLVNADVTLLEHEKTGAVVMLLENEDNNRAFDISFRTPVADDTGVPHVFEHATLNGSKKYPSKSLFFNLIYQTYNTFMNAMTGPMVTTYPVASLSEAQLLKYADFYTDSVFNPMILEDESIFQEEAWRYALPDKDADLGLLGTVYSEMSGAYDLNTAGYFDFRAALYPGSRAGYYFAGKPAHIPEMTWQHLKDFHAAWYHPSNSLTMLYGKLEQADDFLALLDGYFSAFDKRTFAYDDTGYAPLTAPVEAQAQFPVEAGSDTERGAAAYFGYALADATMEDKGAMDLLAVLLNEASSPFQQAMKEQLPAVTASCTFDDLTPEPGLFFSARGINPEEAPIFRGIVEESLKNIQDNGFDLEAVEAVAASTRLQLLLSSEGSTVGTDLLVNIAYNWAAADGDPLAYARYVDNTQNYVRFAEEGVYQDLLSRLTVDNPRVAMLTMTPAPGQKEAQDAALTEKLQQKKAEMSEADIAALVDAAANFEGKQEDDAAQYVGQLQAVSVDTLPEERRMYTITDETGADQVRRMHAQADVSGVGHALLLLDAGTLPQEDLHWYKLFTELVGKLDTAQRPNAALTALMTRYLYQLDLRPTVYVGADRQGVYPKLRVSWIAMDEDMAPAYDLVYELLYETKLDDAQKVANLVTQTKNNLRQAITQMPYQLQIYRAYAYASPGFQYYNYLYWLDYYTFLEQAEQLFEQDPAVALQRLQAVQAHLRARPDAVSAFAGSEDSAPIHRQSADAFLAKLDDTTREQVTYSLPAIAQREAIVVDAAVQYNMLYAPKALLGLEQTSAEFDALGMLLADTYLQPQLREQYGAYGVQHMSSEDGVMMLTFMDPNIQETFDVYAAMPDAIEAMDLNQETINGYILSAYSGYTLSQGELQGALSALLGTLDERPQEVYLQWMKELKGLTPEKVQAYAPLYRQLSEQGHRSTAGGAAILKENAELFDVVYNPFGVKEADPGALSDVASDAWYKEAVDFVLNGNIMKPVNEGAFEPDKPITAGEASEGFLALMGAPSTPAEEAMRILRGGGVLKEDVKAEDILTREQLVHILYVIFSQVADMSGESLTVEPFPEGLADADTVSPQHVDAVRFSLGAGYLTLKDGLAAPQEAATRADLAYLFWSTSQEE